MASEYGAAVTWVVIIFTILVMGLCIMFLGPVFDQFYQIGLSTGSDPTTLGVIYDALKQWLPIVVVMSLIGYGYRKSTRRIE